MAERIELRFAGVCLVGIKGVLDRREALKGHRVVFDLGLERKLADCVQQDGLTGQRAVGPNDEAAQGIPEQSLHLIELRKGSKLRLTNDLPNLAAVIAVGHHEPHGARPIVATLDVEVEVDLGAKVSGCTNDEGTCDRATHCHVGAPGIRQLDFAAGSLCRCPFVVGSQVAHQNDFGPSAGDEGVCHFHSQQLDVNLTVLAVAGVVDLQRIRL
ncbi:hypothetical protein D3C81_1464940 [compost metagenome]